MWGRVAAGAAVVLSSSACTVLFSFELPEVDGRPGDADGVADAGPGDAGSCGQVLVAVTLPGAALGAEVVFDQVLASWEGGGVELIDVVDPAAPVFRDSFALDRPTSGLDVSLCPTCRPDENGRTPVTIYVSDAGGLGVLSTEGGLGVVARLDAGEAAVDAVADRAGEVAIAGFDDGRISVLEVGGVRPGFSEILSLSDGERVVRAPCGTPRLAVLETGVGAALVDGPGCGPSLWIFSTDAKRGGEPVTVALGAPAFDIAQAGDHALLIAGGTAGLLRVDLADPTRPVVTTLPLPHDAVAVAAFATDALVAGDRTLMIVDLSDLDAVSVVAEVALEGEPRAVAATRSAAFVSLGDEGLAVVDVGCFLAPDGPLWDGRDDLGGDGDDDGRTPSKGPTACEPAQVCVESADGRLQCAAGCRTVSLGDATWCTTDCTSDAQCMGVASFCERQEDYCVHGCQTDEQCRDLGLHRCDPVNDYCI